MNFERYDNMTLEELEAEKRDLMGAINNENVWGLGAHTVAEFNMASSNMIELRQELDYVNALIAERKMKNEALD